MAQDTLHTIPSVARLVTELIGDLRTLVQQHVRLLRHEVEAEVAKVKRATIAVAVGVGILAVSGLLFIIMLVHLVQWLTEWPLWICYGMVATAGAIGGLVALLSAKKTGSSVHVLPVKTMQSMKEDAQWITQTIGSKKT
ncbi:MAG TPA: phage holin family protein [Nitrospiraceae bacterium]|nr:phage holin family protein [Nitrospiraceae bacterium]